jgi:hypothetical protein
VCTLSFALLLLGRRLSDPWNDSKTPLQKECHWVLCTKKNIQILLDTSYKNNTQKVQLKCIHKLKTFKTAVNNYQAHYQKIMVMLA